MGCYLVASTAPLGVGYNVAELKQITRSDYVQCRLKCRCVKMAQFFTIIACDSSLIKLKRVCNIYTLSGRTSSALVWHSVGRSIE